MRPFLVPLVALILMTPGCRDNSSGPVPRDDLRGPDPAVSQRIRSAECGAVAMQQHGSDTWEVFNVPDGTNQEMADCAYSVLVGQGLEDGTVVVIHTMQQRIKETTWGCIKAGMANC